jgi:hypothetical protein
LIIGISSTVALKTCVLWDKHDVRVDNFTWFNPTTMIASIPLEEFGDHARVEVSRFEFQVSSTLEAQQLQGSLPPSFRDLVVVVEDDS